MMALEVPLVEKDAMPPSIFVTQDGMPVKSQAVP